MNLPVLAEWARTPAYSLPVLAVLAAVLAFAVQRVRRAVGHTPAAVVVAAVGAIVCTAYSGDTSWNFARDHLHMASAGERSVMFAAAEIGLFSMALMARQNLRTTGAPGTPGVLVWVITGVQVIPAYSESGVVGGTVRAFVGPVLAALLWHLAMGIELRHHKPGADSQSLPAILVRELRERLLSYLGLSQRGRDAAQITRDRWTGIATRRAARLADLEAGKSRPFRLARARRRLAVAVDRTDAGVLPEQRAVLLDRIAAYRGAGELALMELPAPWASRADIDTTAAVAGSAAVSLERVPAPQPVPEVQPEAYPQILAGVPGPDSELSPAASSVRPEPLAVLAAEAPRTRAGVHAEYVPEPEVEPISEVAAERLAQMMTGDPVHRLRDHIGDEAFRALWPEQQPEPVDDSPPPPGEDTLTAQARADFLDVLVAGGAPSIRDLKDKYAIGQDRATRIKAELTKGLA